MTLDTDGKIRMDCSSPNAMASLIANKSAYDISTGNDADADRHGIVHPDVGLMNPNSYLAVAIQYLYDRRGWTREPDRQDLVSSSMIDRVAEASAAADRGAGRLQVVRAGLLDGRSASAARSPRVPRSCAATAAPGPPTRTASCWPCWREITAVTGKSPSRALRRADREARRPAYARVDAPANREQKAKLAKLDSSAVTATELAGEPITRLLTRLRATTRRSGVSR
jgi:phosphoglucomutase